MQSFKLEKERLKYLLKLNDKKGDLNLPAVIQNLDLYYIVAKMEYCSYLLTRERDIIVILLGLEVDTLIRPRDRIGYRSASGLELGCA